MKSRQNCLNHKYEKEKKNLSSFGVVLHEIYMVLIYYLHGYFIYRECRLFFSMSFLIFTFKDKNLEENLTNLAETLKIVGPHGVHRACFFQLYGPSAKSSGGQDCQGKIKGQGLVEHCWWTKDTDWRIMAPSSLSIQSGEATSLCLTEVFAVECNNQLTKHNDAVPFFRLIEWMMTIQNNGIQDFSK